MNPLFLAHLLGDFLFQPYTLVKFKEKSNAGIAVHALVHFAMMLLLWIPRSPILLLGYLGVVILHGIIDRTKVTLQKSGLPFGIGFFVDQILHFLTLFCMMILFFDFSDSPMENVWKMPSVQIGSFVLAGLVYLLALYNIVYKQKATPGLPEGALLNRTLIITASFMLFTLLPLVF